MYYRRSPKKLYIYFIILNNTQFDILALVSGDRG
jgi:hypothetical protein